MPATLFVVSTPIGNLEDITLRAIRTLREVALIAAEDTRRTAKLLQHYQIHTPMVSLHEHNEREKTPALVARLLAGDPVALVSDAGTPLVSDPGCHLVGEALAAGIRVEAVPGPSALVTALVASGLPMKRFTFVGFPPARSGPRGTWFQELSRDRGTLVLYEAPHRIRGTLADVHRHLGDRLVVVARELTKRHETISRGWVSDLLDGELDSRGEYVVLVSDQKKPPASEAVPVSDASVVAEFGLLTKSGDCSRRDAVALLAERHGIPKQRVYKLVQK